MDFSHSNRVFEEIFTISEKQEREDTSVDSKKEFIKKLYEHIEKSSFREAKILKKWIDQSGNLYTFTCRIDVFYQISEGLKESNIPYLLVKNELGDMRFIIREKDARKQKEIAAKVLKQASTFCYVVTGKEAKEIYRKSKDPDKTILIVTGLNHHEIRYIENLCNEVLKNSVIGIDQMEDETYTLTFHAKAIMGESHEKTIKTAIIETFIILNGNVKEEYIKKTSNEVDYWKAKATGFLDKNQETKENVWIVGGGSRFIKRTIRGFELGHAEEYFDDVVLETDLRVSFSDLNYEKRLNSALNKIINHQCLYNISDVINHFKTKKAYPYSTLYIGEKKIIEHADRIVTKKMKERNTTSLDREWFSKFQYYKKEMIKLLKSVAHKKVPKGYSKDDVIELMQIVHYFEINTDKMLQGVEALNNIELYQKDLGQMKKIKDIEVLINKYKENASKELQQEQDKDFLQNDNIER